MAYAFNDDKTKAEVYKKSEVYSKDETYSKEELRPKSDFVVITGTITGVNRNKWGYEQISASTLLNTYGVEDLTDYTVISAMQKMEGYVYKENSYTGVEDGYSAYITYPRVLIYTDLYGSSPYLYVQCFNHADSADPKSIDYEVVLMKIA